MKQSDTYSWRRDPDVPVFPDEAPLVVMDGDCALCTRGARWIAWLDRDCVVRICPVQSGLGSALLRHAGFDPTDPESWLLIMDGRLYTSLDAMIRLGGRLGGWSRLLQPLRVLPRPVQDWLYRRLARNRISLFGRADLCAVPDPALRARLLTD